MGSGRVIRRTLVAALTVALVAGAVLAPATVAQGAATAARCPKGTRSGVADAYAAVFGRTLPATLDDRAGLLVGGDDPALRAVLGEWVAAGSAGGSSSVVVVTVRCPSPRRAVVDADLVLAGVPLPDVLPPGRAVRDAGLWKVSRDTFCTRMALEDPSVASSGACRR